jgi:hypothetical protein
MIEKSEYVTNKNVNSNLIDEDDQSNNNNNRDTPRLTIAFGSGPKMRKKKERKESD